MKLEGIDNLKKILTAIVLKPDEIGEVSRPAANKIKYKMQDNAPEKTGEFKTFILVFERKKRPGLTVGPWYSSIWSSKGQIGHLLEYGHVARDGKTFVPGTGFIQRTWMEVKSEVEKDMIANLEKKITQIFNG